MGNVYGTVSTVADVGPRIRRIVFDVPELANLRLPGRGDDAVGIYFPAPGSSRPPAMQCRDGVWDFFDAADTPEGRNYSVRRIDPDDWRVTCDFVLHQRGVASDWPGGSASVSTSCSHTAGVGTDRSRPPTGSC